jgi:hypothetical protein
MPKHNVGDLVYSNFYISLGIIKCALNGVYTVEWIGAEEEYLKNGIKPIIYPGETTRMMTDVEIENLKLALNHKITSNK